MTEPTPDAAATQTEEASDAPPSGSSDRSPRLRGRWRLLIALGIVAWVILGAYLFLATPDEAPEERGAGTETRDAPAPLLWIVRGPEGQPPAMALVHGDPEAPVVVLIPVGTVLEVPGRGPRSLEVALGESGPLGVGTSVANALGVRVPGALVARPEELAAFVDGVGGVEVEVPETVEVEEEGVLRQVFTEGPARMDGAELTEFMTRAVPERRETDRVARQGAAWRGVFEALGDERPETVATLLEGWEAELAPDRAAGLLRQTSGEDGELRILTLPVQRSPVPGDLYEVVEEELDFLHESLSGIRTVEEGASRSRVRLLVGAEGHVGPAVARELIDAGYRIVLTGRASGPYDVSRAVIAENTDELRSTARDLLGLLGTGELGVYERPQTVFDVTLVVGRDWAEANGFPQPEPAPEDE